jgi:hypothetical protein
VITRSHIKKYLNKLSSSDAAEGGAPGAAWRDFHEYVVRHYQQLDQGARAIADEIFDELDAAVEERIASLPEGKEKRTLVRKFSMVRGERSPLPIIYLDTPVMEDVIRFGLGQSLAGKRACVEAFYEQLRTSVRAGRLICPEDVFHREALQNGGPQADEALDILKGLSEGLSFRHGQSIEDVQVFRAIRGFINGHDSMDYRKFWKDAFPKPTIRAIMGKRSTVSFQNGLVVTAGPAAELNTKHPHGAVRLRIRHDAVAFDEERQLQKRSARHLRDLVRLGMRYWAIKDSASGRQLEGFWAGQKTDLSLALWNHYGGQPQGTKGLASFFESTHFRDIPTMKIRRDVWKQVSGGRKGGLANVTGPAAIDVISSVLPYTDIMILGLKMTEAVRDVLGLGVQYDTEIFSMDEQDVILDALKSVPCGD